MWTSAATCDTGRPTQQLLRHATIWGKRSSFANMHSWHRMLQLASVQAAVGARSQLLWGGRREGGQPCGDTQHAAAACTGPNAAAAAGGRPGPTSWRRAAVQQHHHASLRSDSGCSRCLTNPWPTLSRRASWHEGDSRGSSQPALDPAQARLGRHGQAARQPAAPAPVPSQLAPGAFPPNAQRPAL